MDLTKESIDRILELAEIEHYFTPDGREFTSQKLFPLEESVLSVLQLDTLKGLVDYLRSGFDKREIGRFYPPASTDGDKEVPSDPLQVALHVISPHLVAAFLPIAGSWKNRFYVAKAQWSRQPFPFGSWLSQEEFIIKMQAMFLSSESWQPVMDVAGKIVCEDTAELMDNGISQAVTVHRGVRKESGIILPNPVKLKPVRTFTEVDQPESSFVFRMRSDPIALSLHEADMGAWEMVAKQNIKAYLETELPGIPVFV